MKRVALLTAVLVPTCLVVGCAPGADKREVDAHYVAPRSDASRASGPVKVTAEEMRSLLVAARRGAAGDPSSARTAHENLVVVSIYGRDSRGRPLVPFPAIGQAGGETRALAAKLAGARAALDLRGRRWVADKSGFKIDLPGRPGNIRQGLPQLTAGLDGLLLVTPHSRQVYVPGSLYHADRPSTERFLSLAAAAAGLTTSRPQIHRTFRSTSFANASPSGGVLPLYRGNVLLKTPDAATLRSAARLGGTWLAKAVRANGQYYYRGYQEDRYNLARHCGTVWGLYLSCAKTGRKDKRLLTSANRGLDWMRKLCRAKNGKGDFGMPKFQTQGPTASSVALALLALVEGYRVSGRKELLPEAIAMGDLAVKGFGHPSGRFYEWWNPRTGLPAGKLSFIYHPGELILAFVGLYEISGKKRFLDTAVRGMHAQVRAEAAHFAETKTLPPDAWTVQAIEALEKVAPPRKEWRAHAFLLADHLIKGQWGAPTGPEPKAPDYLGGMNNLDPPIACAAGARGEGIVAAERIAVKAGELERARGYRRQLLAAARFGLEGQFRPDNSFWLPDPHLALGGVRQSLTDTTVRIDYVQHCVATWLGAAEMLERK